MSARGWIAAVLLLAGTAAPAGRAGEIVAARIEVAPERPFVNQAFALHLVIETTPGCELQGLSIEGLPGAEAVAFGTPDPRPRVQERRGDATVDVLRYVAEGRGLRPLRGVFRPSLSLTLVERRTTGFFSSWTSSPRGVRLPPVSIEIRELPAEGRPEGFAGAVGHFALKALAAPVEAAVDDLVTVTIEADGRGWLGDAAPVLPPPGPAYRVYPAQELAREPRGRWVMRQVVIPLATNAPALPAVRFVYFDPQEERYRTAAAALPALRLTQVRREQGSVRTLAPPRMGTAAPPAATVVLPASLGVDLRRVAPFAFGLLAAALAAGALRGRRWWLAVCAGVAAFAGVAAGTHLVWPARGDGPVVTVRSDDVLRLAPAVSARSLGSVAAGSTATVIETAEGWERVAVGRRRGWLPASSLRPVPERGKP